MNNNILNNFLQGLSQNTSNTSWWSHYTSIETNTFALKDAINVAHLSMFSYSLLNKKTFQALNTTLGTKIQIENFIQEIKNQNIKLIFLEEIKDSYIEHMFYASENIAIDINHSYTKNLAKLKLASLDDNLFNKFKELI